MNYWIQNLIPYGSPEKIGVIQLAWLGDSVWELHQRLRHVHSPLKSKDLHMSVVNEVNSRATGFETLIGWLFLKDPKRLSEFFLHLENKI